MRYDDLVNTIARESYFLAAESITDLMQDTEFEFPADPASMADQAIEMFRGMMTEDVIDKIRELQKDLEVIRSIELKFKTLG